MTRDEMQELKRLAESATPGPWHSRHHGVFTSSLIDAVCNVSLTTGHYESENRNRDFIAAANPAVVLSLIARIEELEAERDAAKRKAEESHRAGMLFGLGVTL